MRNWLTLNGFRIKAAAERGLFRAMKEFRQVEREARASKGSPEVGAAREALGSFLPAESIQALIETLPVNPPRSTPQTPAKPVVPAWNPPKGTAFDLPFTIGRTG